MILITTYYKTMNIERNNEIDKCLLNNIHNKYIETIYLLNNQYFEFDFLDDIQKIKIKQIIISTKNDYKLLFKDAILFINHYLKDKVCILSNSDIYFNETLSLVSNLSKNIFYALLRYEEDENNCFQIFSKDNIPRNDSQDSWIFKSPLHVNVNRLNFEFGTLGCDNIFATIVSNNCNIQIRNPSLDIISIHVHTSNFRTYNEKNRIHGKYCLITPSKINSYINPLTFIFL